MAFPICCSFLTYFSSLTILLCISFLSSFDNKCFALQQQQLQQNSNNHYLSVKLNSLFPASICSHSSVGESEKEEASYLKVVHKHGPCNTNYNQEKIDHVEILQHDVARVESIHVSSSSEKEVKLDGSTELPAKSGAVVGSGNYIVRVGLGSSKQELSLIFDTGSDVTWTQCKPCSKSCYTQKETIFDPSLSSSYYNISCTSTDCSNLKSATGITPGCATGTSTCIYGIQYGDQSYSVGLFGKDTLTLTPKDVLSGFLFGCGQNNQGLFGGAAGLLGLGRNKISFIEQTAAKYGRRFSYCLPTSASSTGYLSFGSAAAQGVSYTPMATLPVSGSFYAVSVVAITVGGKKLSAVTPALFAGSGTIVDSGTVITRLPPTAYAALSEEFRRQMAAYKYPTAPALSILDTCFDLSKYDTVSIPKVVFYLSGNTAVSLAAPGILYAARPTQVCLAFAANKDDRDVSIFGNVQQRTLRVVYDIAAAKIGFGSAGCS